MLLCNLQLLNQYPSVYKEFQNIPRVCMLLLAPFEEAGLRIDVVIDDMNLFFSGAQLRGVSKPTEMDRLSNQHVKLVSAALHKQPFPQHGDLPGQTSVQLITSTLKNRVKALSLNPNSTLDWFSQVAADSGQTGQWHTNFTKLGAEALNVQLLPGEAAQLVYSWTRIPLLAEEWSYKIHPIYDISLAMGHSLFTNGAVEADCHSLVDVSELRSFVEYVEALYRAGVLMT